jgi:hypothetical protein
VPVACGIGTFVGLRGTVRDLDRSLARFYDETEFADGDRRAVVGSSHSWRSKRIDRFVWGEFGTNRSPQIVKGPNALRATARHDPRSDMPGLYRDSSSSDRDVTVRVVADGGRRRPFIGSIVSLVVIGALAVGVLGIAGVVTGILDFPNPFSTSTVDRSSPALLKEINNLSAYSAAQGRFEQTVDVERDVSILPSFIAGERTTFLANGTVDATVDFSALAAGAVKPRGGGAVTITLPEPRLGTAVIDPKTSRVVGRERGLLDRVGGIFSDSPTGEQKFYVLAQDKLGKAAKHSHLIQRAERNTAKMLQGFLGKLGYTDVNVVFKNLDREAAGAAS